VRRLPPERRTATLNSLTRPVTSVAAADEPDIEDRVRPARAVRGHLISISRSCRLLCFDTPGEGCLSGQTPGHVVDHRPENHCAGAGGQGFVVAGQPAVQHQPAVRALDGPAFALRGEALLLRILGHHLYVDTVRGAAFDDTALVAGVDPGGDHRG